MTDALLKTKLSGEIAAIETFLAAAAGIMESGHMPDITNLESRVAVLCKDIQKAPAEIHEFCLPRLVKLMDQLNETEKQMRLWHDAHKKNIQ